MTSFEGLPGGSLVLVSHGTRPIALQVIKQLLERGYRVRTTTGHFANASWLDTLFFEYAYYGMFEHVKISCPYDSRAYMEAIKGVDAVVHTADIPFLGPHLDDVKECAIFSIWSMFDAALSEPSVRAFVLTSPFVAAAPLAPPVDIWVDEGT